MTSPIYSLHCLGLGAIPKKIGKWRMIMHLSAPAGRSVNDGIHLDEFSLHYSSVDDTVAILLHLGKGALMVKIDHKSAFSDDPSSLCGLGLPWHALVGTALRGHLPAIWLRSAPMAMSFFGLILASS